MNEYGQLFLKISEFEFKNKNGKIAEEYFNKAVKYNVENLSLNQAEIDTLYNDYADKSIDINIALLTANFHLLSAEKDSKIVMFFLTEKYFKLKGLADIFFGIVKFENEIAQKLTLKKKWFDMILSGEKTEEYREIKPYWLNRFTGSVPNTYNLETYLTKWLQNKDIPHQVIFYNGNYYSDKLSKFTIELKDIEINKGKTEWGAEKDKIYFVLKLGSILSKSNCG